MHEFGRFAIVVAHPDDEVLWMSSLVAKAEKVVICFGDIPSRPAMSERRRAAVAALPHPGIEFLDLSESEVFSSAQWPEPAETPFGLETKRRPYSMAGYDDSRYRNNYLRLVERFTATLRGFDSVVTHNPWGEYGHEEHVQVFRAVEATSRELGFAVWVSCYVGNKTLQLMRRHLHRLGTQTPLLPTDAETYAAFRDIYHREGVWTWSPTYPLPACEVFYRLRGPEARDTQDTVRHLICCHFPWTGSDPSQAQSSLRSRIAARVRRLLS